MTVTGGPARAVLGLAWTGVRRRPLATALTVLSVALGVGLAVGVVLVADSAEDSFDRATRGYDIVLGPPKGSALQSVLVTLFHADEAAGTVPWSAYERALADPRVKTAVPYAVGDVLPPWGFRVVGTTRAVFETLLGADGRPLGADVRGRLFDESAFEAVVGSHVGAVSALSLGRSFQVVHGAAGVGEAHGESWVVTGVLRPTGTPNDRAVFVPLDSFFAVAGHGEAAKRKDLSAIGLAVPPSLRLPLFYELRGGRDDVQAAMPFHEVRKLKTLVGDRDRAFRAMAWLAVAVALLGILVSLYTATQARRREIAVLRALGARPVHVFSVIVLEALLLCLLGGAAGLLIGHVGAPTAAPALLRMFGVESYGVTVDASLRPFDAQVVGALAVLGLLAGLLPAWRGLRTPVAENLHPTD